MLNREMNVITFAQIPTATRLAPAVILGKILNFLAFDPSEKLSQKLLVNLWSLEVLKLLVYSHTIDVKS